MRASLSASCQRLETGGRILVTRLRHLGDIVLTLPLLEVLSRRFPRAELHYLAERPGLDVLAHLPFLTRAWESPRASLASWRRALELRRCGFDLGIDLFANPRSALLMFASGARTRVGEDRRFRRLLYTHPRHLQPGRTALAQHLAVIAELGLPPEPPRRPRLHLTAAERQHGRARLPPGDRVVLLHLDASHAAKEWPSAHAAELVQRLYRRGIAVVVGRAPGAAQASRSLLGTPDLPASFLPALPLRAYLGVAAACDAVVGVDGGILHCSVALGLPTVGLFGPTDASIWFPYTDLGPYRVLHLGSVEGHPEPRTSRVGCLAGIDPAQVEQTLIDVMQLRRQAAGEEAP